MAREDAPERERLELSAVLKRPSQQAFDGAAGGGGSRRWGRQPSAGREIQVRKNTEKWPTLGRNRRAVPGQKGRLGAREPWDLRAHRGKLSCTLEPEEA